jgi:hypothetical protein
MYGVAEIYGFKDPRYPQIEYMYIGYTSGDSRRRFSFHKWSGTAPVKAWIDSLRADGKEPVMCIIDRVPVARGPAREQELIEEYDPPLNQRKGGGGIRKKTGGWSEPRNEYHKSYNYKRRWNGRLVSLELWAATLGDDGETIINGQHYDAAMEWGSYSDSM